MTDFELLIPNNVNELLNSFNRMDYKDAFAGYAAGCRGFTEGLREWESIDAAADEAVKYMDGRITGLWKKRRLCDMRYFLLVYISPALLADGSEDALAFAKALQRAWSASHPGEGYEMTTYEELAGGFNHTVLGFNADFR